MKKLTKDNKYTKFVKSRGKGYTQPYEGFPYYINIEIMGFEVWVDLSKTAEFNFNWETDRAIARAFLSEGRNSIRTSINNLLKHEENHGFNDPLDLNY